MAMDVPAKIEHFWDKDNTTVSPSTTIPGQMKGNKNFISKNLNFSTVAVVEENEYVFPKKKTVRDPLSHRIIEKRRRDRMNNCLADLARLLPPSSLRKGRGRIEKTEIVEIAIKQMRHLQCHPCPNSDNCEYSQIGANRASAPETSSGLYSGTNSPTPLGFQIQNEDNFCLGFQECLRESMKLLVEQEGMYAADPFCIRFVKHLNEHCASILQNQINNKPNEAPDGKTRVGSGDSISSSGYQPNGSSSASESNSHDRELNYRENDAKRSSSPYDSRETNTGASTPVSMDYSERNSSPINLHMSNGLSDEKTNRYGKFKSNIKQRFTATLKSEDEEDKKPTAAELQLHAAETVVEKSSESERSSSHEEVVSEENSSRESVPAFVLCEKDLYYVPMAIDKSLLSPVMSSLRTDPLPPLYPVTISVCFLQGSSGLNLSKLDQASASLSRTDAPNDVMLPKINSMSRFQPLHSPPMMSHFNATPMYPTNLNSLHHHQPESNYANYYECNSLNLSLNKKTVDKRKRSVIGETCVSPPFRKISESIPAFVDERRHSIDNIILENTNTTHTAKKIRQSQPYLNHDHRVS